jgi:nitrous oxidase accessory protein NosD
VPVTTPSASASASTSASPAPATSLAPALTTAVTCPTATVTVGSTAALTAALSHIQPGAVIELADGTYSGQFTMTAIGTAAQPVFLCGGRGAVLDGGDIKKGYALHVTDSSYVRLVGFTAQDAQKGVVLDDTQDSVVQGLLVQQTGDEGIHLRERSSDDLVIGNTVTGTGLKRAKYGEGVYVGSAESNWCTYTACQPDTSDHDIVKGNVFGSTTAENIDIKEGTTGGQILDNTLDGAGMSPAGASAWVNVKGNDYLIEGNTGRGSLKDGFQTHQILAGWGTDNTFKDNTAIVDGPGFGFHLTPVLGNTVACDNTEQGAGQGLSNVPCS